MTTLLLLLLPQLPLCCLQYPKLMVYGLVESAIYWTNAFPTKNSASDTLSASSIVIGRASPDGSKPSIAYGSYALVFARSTNIMAARKIPCIALNPSNEWGGYYFMSLYTGKRIHSYAWTVLPITDDVVARVHELASLEKQPLIKKGQPFFEWNPGIPIADDPIDLSDEVSLDTIHPHIITLNISHHQLRILMTLHLYKVRSEIMIPWNHYNVRSGRIINTLTRLLPITPPQMNCPRTLLPTLPILLKPPQTVL